MYRLVVRYHSNYYNFTHEEVCDWVDSIESVVECANPFSKNYYSILIVETNTGGRSLLKSR